jgi:hypothetical protein
MAIESLNQRLDQLTPENIQVQQTLPNIEPPPFNADTEAILPADEQPVDEFVPEAGLFTQLVKKNIKKAPINTERKILQDDIKSGKVGAYTVVREEAPAGKVLTDAQTAPISGRPSPTTEQKAAGVEKTIFNLDLIKDADGVRQFIEAIAKEYGADKLPKMSYKEVAEKAALEGYDERFLARILDPKVQTTASPEDAYKMMLALTDAGKRVFDLANQIKVNAINGTHTPDLITQFHQAIALEGVLAKAAKGRQADVARTLGIFSQARTSSSDRGAQLAQIINEAGGIKNSFELANSYLALDSRADRAALSEKTISGKLRDVWYSTFINGLLSSPVTHAKNIVGNAAFGAYMVPERLIASGIGKTRNFLFKGGEDAIQLNEVHAQAMGMLQGIREGGSISLTAFKKNESTDALTKIENFRNGRDTFNVSFGDSSTGQALNTAMKYWGGFVTLPSRTLMAEDEFFKAVGYRMELNALVTREANKEYKSLLNSRIMDDATNIKLADFENDLIKKGTNATEIRKQVNELRDQLYDPQISEQEAAKRAAALHEKLLVEPSAEIEEAAKSMASTATFTRDLEEGLQGAAKFMKDTPVLNIFFPFVKTPTNIAMEAMSRTPLINFASPRFWADFNAGGIQRDMAMARVTLGSLIVFGAGSYALDGRITGYGPMRSEDKAALEGTGWQQFSFVFNKSDVSPELLAQYKEITQIKETPDKVYISYAGIEPFSSMLSIAATTGEFSMVRGSHTVMDKMMMGATLGLYSYTAEQPMLQGFGEIMKIFSTKSKDGATALYNIMAQVTKQSTSYIVGGSPAGAYSSFIGGIERLVRPEKSLVLEAVSPDDIGMINGAEKGFWQALGQYCSRNPLCSDTLPVQKDPITGFEKRIGKGNWAEMFDPFKTSEGKYSPAHAVLVEFGVPMPDVPKKIDGVELTDKQYNQWIEIATQTFNLEDNIVKLGSSKEFRAYASQDLAGAQSLITKLISDAYNGTPTNQGAKYILLADPENMDLADAIEGVKEKQREYGKYNK